MAPMSAIRALMLAALQPGASAWTGWLRFANALEPPKPKRKKMRGNPLETEAPPNLATRSPRALMWVSSKFFRLPAGRSATTSARSACSASVVSEGRNGRVREGLTIKFPRYKPVGWAPSSAARCSANSCTCRGTAMGHATGHVQQQTKATSLDTQPHFLSFMASVARLLRVCSAVLARAQVPDAARCSSRSHSHFALLIFIYFFVFIFFYFYFFVIII
jgi:hypothetical protein